MAAVVAFVLIAAANAWSGDPAAIPQPGDYRTHSIDTTRYDRETLPAGTRVQVFSRFNASWVGGFEIATSLDGGYQLVRLSDRAVLPKIFLTEDLRPHRR